MTTFFSNIEDFKVQLRKLKVMPTHYNRLVSEHHVERMMASVRKLGILRSIVVVKTKAFSGNKMEYYILDGQHLTKAILNLDNKVFKDEKALHINIVELDTITKILDCVTTLNSTAKNWSNKDYLSAYITDGRKSYIDLQKILVNTKLPLNGIIECFTGANGASKDAFKAGTLKLDKKTGNETLSFYNKALKLGLNPKNSTFLAIVRFLNTNQTVNRVKLLGFISDNIELFKKSDNRDYYLNYLKLAI